MSVTIGEFREMTAGIPDDVRVLVVARFEPDDWPAAFVAARTYLGQGEQR